MSSHNTLLLKYFFLLTSKFLKLINSILFKGGHEYFVEVQAKARASHYLGEEKEAKNIELFVDYKVDGILGTGICEWNYRNIKE